MSDELKKDTDAWSGCMVGALLKQEYLKAIRDAGFSDVEELSEKAVSWKGLDERMVGNLISVSVSAHKPE